MPKVSIVLPVYNGERYIRESIDSIVSQTMTDWELVIVNDCSTDKTSTIIEEYAQKDRRIRIIHNHTNKNLPASLNIGFSEAIGEYLTWTSDDNIYLPNALDTMYKRLVEDDECYMVCADMQYIDTKGNVTGDSIRYDNKFICYMNNVGACFLYRRQVKEEIGDYNPDLLYVEDYDYWLRVRKTYGRIERIDEILYQYRQHDCSLSETKRRSVRVQLARLRKQQLDFILSTLCEEHAHICYIFNEFLVDHIEVEDIKEQFYVSVPQLKNFVYSDLSVRKFVIFGSGDFGMRAVKVLGQKAICFIDNNYIKVGQTICELKVHSFHELPAIKEDYIVMIAVEQSKWFSIIQQLNQSGDYKYCTYQYYMSQEGQV